VVADAAPVVPPAAAAPAVAEPAVAAPVPPLEPPSVAVPETAPALPASAAEPADNTTAGDRTNKYLVNLNRCTAEDLTRIAGIGAVLARRIIDYRTAHGSFLSLDDLRQVPGIGRKTFRALTGPKPRMLNRLLGVAHDEELSLQEIVRLTTTLPGVAGCTLAMSDGVLLTGQLPAHLDQNAISVFAPQLFKKVGRYVRELKVGDVRRLTIFTDQQPVSIFQAGEVYLVVIHQADRFSKALLRRCERISKEIARLCQDRAVV
jgi:competence ComEA-like helix-hairpin-helix protein